MHAQMVRLQNGWYIPDLPGFDDIRDDAVAVSVELDHQEFMQRNYKELRGIAIVERYQEKAAQEDALPEVIEGREAFRQRFGLEGVHSLADLWERLR
ncbi:MAG: hypothetical protein RKO66_16635 [Candidatus Contendobacter sp.]|nr:hypothetical protein [Candidatus Contendobacter sp.]